MQQEKKKYWRLWKGSLNNSVWWQCQKHPLSLTQRNYHDSERRLKAEVELKEDLQRDLMEATETLEQTQSLLNESFLVKQGKQDEDDDSLQLQFSRLERMLTEQTATVASLKSDLNHTKAEASGFINVGKSECFWSVRSLFFLFSGVVFFGFRNLFVNTQS